MEKRSREGEARWMRKKLRRLLGCIPKFGRKSRKGPWDLHTINYQKPIRAAQRMSAESLRNVVHFVCSRLRTYSDALIGGRLKRALHTGTPTLQRTNRGTNTSAYKNSLRTSTEQANKPTTARAQVIRTSNVQ